MYMSIQPVYTVYTTCMCTQVFVLFKIRRNCQSWEIFPSPAAESHAEFETYPQGIPPTLLK